MPIFWRQLRSSEIFAGAKSWPHISGPSDKHHLSLLHFSGVGGWVSQLVPRPQTISPFLGSLCATAWAPSLHLTSLSLSEGNPDGGSKGSSMHLDPGFRLSIALFTANNQSSVTTDNRWLKPVEGYTPSPSCCV